LFILVAGCSEQSATPESATDPESAQTASTDDVSAYDEQSNDSTAHVAAAPPPAKAPAAAKPAPSYVVVGVAAGTEFEVEILDTLSSGMSQVGDPVRGRLVGALFADGKRVAPAGAEVRGTITEVVPLKKFGGQPRISLMFESLAVDNGTRVSVMASHTAAGKKQAGRDAAKIGGGAAAGAVIGHQVDDDKGSQLGALIGGAIGTAVAAKTGKEIELTAGTTIIVVLEDDVQVRLAS
jgi:hypothetical protein